MGTEIKAAAIAAALGAFAEGAIADAELELEGAVVGVLSAAAAAGLALLLGDKAIERCGFESHGAHHV